MNTVRAILLRAEKIVRDGGDPNPCKDGPFCLACCIAVARSNFDNDNKIWSWDENDGAMLDAIDRCERRVGNDQTDALGILQRALAQ